MYIRTTSLPILYIRNIMPDAMGISLPEHLGLSGWGEPFNLRSGSMRSSSMELPLIGFLGSCRYFPACFQQIHNKTHWNVTKVFTNNYQQILLTLGL